MTRGKHSEMASRRREVESAASQIETYKAAVARLTAENNELRRKMSAGMDAAKQTERALRAQIREGTSAEVVALESEVRRLRDERDQAKREWKKTRQTWTNAFTRMCEYIRTNSPTPISRRESVDIAITILGTDEERERGLRVVDTKGKSIDQAGMARIIDARKVDERFDRNIAELGLR